MSKPKNYCQVNGCERPCVGRGYCSPHYLRVRRGYGLEHPLRHMGDLSARFWSKVRGGDITTCWEWTASRGDGGYGQIMIDRRPHRAHRVAWELLRGDIPDGLVLDHLCNNKSCVNPWHLEPVTQAVNVRRARERGAA